MMKFMLLGKLLLLSICYIHGFSHHKTCQYVRQPTITQMTSLSSVDTVPTTMFNDVLLVNNKMHSEVTQKHDRIGEDSALFSFAEQDRSKWSKFSITVTGALSLLYYIWAYDKGLQLESKYLGFVQHLTKNNAHLTITSLLTIFFVIHSGLASLRPFAEKYVGAKIWRYIFALISIPFAFTSLKFFLEHRNDGIQLWNLQSSDPIRVFVWGLSFISFFFLYPSTFNLLEIAGVDTPKYHLWETGIIRITRHPQAIGQILWCVAHTLYSGNSFTLLTSLLLSGYHLFAIKHGEYRMRHRLGDKEYQDYITRTSILPFQAIITGKQVLPQDYYREFLRYPYLIVALGCLIMYALHPTRPTAAFSVPTFPAL